MKNKPHLRLRISHLTGGWYVQLNDTHDRTATWDTSREALSAARYRWRALWSGHLNAFK